MSSKENMNVSPAQESPDSRDKKRDAAALDSEDLNRSPPLEVVRTEDVESGGRCPRLSAATTSSSSSSLRLPPPLESFGTRHLFSTPTGGTTGKRAAPASGGGDVATHAEKSVQTERHRSPSPPTAVHDLMLHVPVGEEAECVRCLREDLADDNGEGNGKEEMGCTHDTLGTGRDFLRRLYHFANGIGPGSIVYAPYASGGGGGGGGGAHRKAAHSPTSTGASSPSSPRGSRTGNNNNNNTNKSNNSKHSTPMSANAEAGNIFRDFHRHHYALAQVTGVQASTGTVSLSFLFAAEFNQYHSKGGSGNHSNGGGTKGGISTNHSLQEALGDSGSADIYGDDVTVSLYDCISCPPGVLSRLSDLFVYSASGWSSAASPGSLSVTLATPRYCTLLERLLRVPPWAGVSGVLSSRSYARQFRQQCMGGEGGAGLSCDSSPRRLLPPGLAHCDESESSCCRRAATVGAGKRPREEYRTATEASSTGTTMTSDNGHQNLSTAAPLRRVKQEERQEDEAREGEEEDGETARDLGDETQLCGTPTAALGNAARARQPARGGQRHSALLANTPVKLESAAPSALTDENDGSASTAAASLPEFPITELVTRVGLDRPWSAGGAFPHSSPRAEHSVSWAQCEYDAARGKSLHLFYAQQFAYVRRWIAARAAAAAANANASPPSASRASWLSAGGGRLFPGASTPATVVLCIFPKFEMLHRFRGYMTLRGHHVRLLEGDDDDDDVNSGSEEEESAEDDQEEEEEDEGESPARVWTRGVCSSPSPVVSRSRSGFARDDLRGRSSSGPPPPWPDRRTRSGSSARAAPTAVQLPTPTMEPSTFDDVSAMFLCVLRVDVAPPAPVVRPAAAAAAAGRGEQQQRGTRRLSEGRTTTATAAARVCRLLAHAPPVDLAVSFREVLCKGGERIRTDDGGGSAPDVSAGGASLFNDDLNCRLDKSEAAVAGLLDFLRERRRRDPGFASGSLAHHRRPPPAFTSPSSPAHLMCVMTSFVFVSAGGGGGSNPSGGAAVGTKLWGTQRQPQATQTQVLDPERRQQRRERQTRTADLLGPAKTEHKAAPSLASLVDATFGGNQILLPASREQLLLLQSVESSAPAPSSAGAPRAPVNPAQAARYAALMERLALGSITDRAATRLFLHLRSAVSVYREPRRSGLGPRDGAGGAAVPPPPSASSPARRLSIGRQPYESGCGGTDDGGRRYLCSTLELQRKYFEQAGSLFGDAFPVFAAVRAILSDLHAVHVAGQARRQQQMRQRRQHSPRQAADDGDFCPFPRVALVLPCGSSGSSGGGEAPEGPRAARDTMIQFTDSLRAYLSPWPFLGLRGGNCAFPDAPAAGAGGTLGDGGPVDPEGGDNAGRVRRWVRRGGVLALFADDPLSQRSLLHLEAPYVVAVGRRAAAWVAANSPSRTPLGGGVASGALARLIAQPTLFKVTSELEYVSLAGAVPVGETPFFVYGGCGGGPGEEGEGEGGFGLGEDLEVLWRRVVGNAGRESYPRVLREAVHTYLRAGLAAGAAPCSSADEAAGRPPPGPCVRREPLDDDKGEEEEDEEEEKLFKTGAAGATTDDDWHWWRPEAMPALRALARRVGLDCAAGAPAVRLSSLALAHVTEGESGDAGGDFSAAARTAADLGDDAGDWHRTSRPRPYYS